MSVETIQRPLEVEEFIKTPPEAKPIASPKSKSGHMSKPVRLKADRWPQSIVEAYQRTRGPYTIENVTILIEEEPVELYNGWLVWQEMTDAEERRIASIIQVILDLAARDLRFGQTYPDQFECMLSNGDIIKPDICLVSWERYDKQVAAAIPSGEHLVLKGAAELVIEMHSPSNTKKEEQLKREKYFANGTLVVWDVDPKKQIVRVWEAIAPKKSRDYKPRDMIDCPQLLPGWRRRVADFFSRDLTVEDIVGEVAARWRKESQSIGLAEGEKQGLIKGEQKGRQEGLAEGEKQGLIKGEQKGRQEGLAEGERRGQLEILNRMLLKMATRRFGEESAQTLPTRLSNFDINQLTALIEVIEDYPNFEEWLTKFGA